MFKQFTHLFSALLLGIIILTVSGCLPQSAPKETVSDEPMTKITIPKIDIFNRLGKKTADGKYVVINLTIDNITTKPLDIETSDLVLQFKSKKQEEQYTQLNEVGMATPFAAEYGRENRDKLLDRKALSINPKMSVERYILFMLSEDASLADFELLFKQDKTTVQLSAPETDIVDHRQSF